MMSSLVSSGIASSLLLPKKLNLLKIFQKVNFLGGTPSRCQTIIFERKAATAKYKSFPS